MSDPIAHPSSATPTQSSCRLSFFGEFLFSCDASRLGHPQRSTLIDMLETAIVSVDADSLDRFSNRLVFLQRLARLPGQTGILT